MSEARVTIGNATLYLGDCLEILPTLGEVDAMITDPPFEAEAHAPGRRLLSHVGTRRRSLVEAPLDFAPMTDSGRAALAAWAAGACSGWLIAFCQAEAVRLWQQAMQENGIGWRRAMVWVKPDSAPQLSGDRPAQGFESIAAGWCGAGRSQWNGGGRRGVFTFGKHDAGSGHGGSCNGHPTQKPLALMSELVRLFTQPGECVVDPFMGSGTTGVACAGLGRGFIGIELDPLYFDIACRRLDQAYRQPRLFPEPAVPQQPKLLP